MSANPQNARPELPDSKIANPASTDPRPTAVGPVGEITGLHPASQEAPPAISHGHGHEALQALLAFSSLHEKIRERRARERLGTQPGAAGIWELEQFALDDVLQLVAERALTLTGADGIAIALAEGNAFVCRASSGGIAPEPGTRLDPNSGFSGVCLRTGGIVRCDDSEKDPRVDLQVCRRLGTRSMVAIPIASSRATIGLLEAFSAEAYGFNDSDVRSLNLLAELILAAMKPEEENRLAEISERVVGSEMASSTLANEAVGTPSVKADTHAVGRSASGASVEFAPTILVEYEQSGRAKWRMGVVAALVLLALAAGLWWKNRSRVTADSRARVEVVAPEQVQPQTALPNSNADGILPEPDKTRPLQQLVTGIWNVSSPDSSTVIIDLQGEVQYEAHRLSEPERIYFDLHGTALSHGLFGKTIEVGDPILARVRIAQPRKGVSRVVLETNGASNFSVSLQSNPYRLVVEIRKASKGIGEPESRVPQTNLPDPGTHDSSPATHLGLERRLGSGEEGRLPANIAKFRLALDAGHGGWDLGTVGRKGLMEKDLVLDIVERLGKMVESRLGAEVIYTRQDDTYLPLEKRTEIANLAQVDMFVSVHANYSNDASARGAETYYTNTYSSLRARTGDGDAGVPENIDWNNVDIREKVQQSRRFAVAVQQAMHRALAAQIPGMRNRGVKKASYVVLTGTSMPAILAEVSFVSSPADEDKLERSSYRQSIAEALYKGIAEYAATTHHVNLASVSPKPKGL